ncbi:hypothetical protein PS850_02602 [Pseudomonas fluorescens]|nr:hypothetical protein PS850_02602 [Pseudomonas fluorescens]
MISIIICLAFTALCISQMLLTINSSHSVTFKGIGFFLLIIATLIKPKLSNSIYWLAPIAVIMALNLITSHNNSAAIEELLRYLFPIIIIIAIYKSPKDIRTAAKFMILITITNNIYQIYFYIAYFTGLPTIAPAFFDAGYLIRAEGWIGSFILFSFMNFLSFILIKHGEILEKKNKRLEWFFILFSLLGLTVKIMAAYAVYFIATYKNKKATKILILSVVAITLMLVLQPKIINDIFISTGGKISAYLLKGDSARAESYRVMTESLLTPNLFGEGLGAFGGPASKTYNSPLYAKYNFNWYGLDDLATTDTYYPHLFVELGLFGGTLYLYFIFFYGQRNRNKMWWVVAFSFLIDNISSFSIAAPPNYFAVAITLLAISFKNDTLAKCRY